MNMLVRSFLTAALLLLPALAGGQTWETFELRAAPFFAGRNVNINDGANGQSPGGFSLVTDMSVTPPQSCASLGNVSIDSSAAAQSWSFEVNGWTATVDAARLQAARDGGYVLWVPFTPPSGAAAEVLVPADRNGHALALVQRDGSGPYVLNTLSFVEWLDGSWFRVSASFDPALPFWVEDLSTNERSETGATHLMTWTLDSTAYPLESVTFVLDGIEIGGRFTLHYQTPGSGQPEMVQSIVAAANGASGWQQMGDWSSVDVSGSAIVTGNVAVGSDYWITRDSDGWSSTSMVAAWHFTLFASHPEPLQWALRGMMPPPPTPLETRTFHIAAGYGWGATVYQPSGTRGLTYVTTGVVTDLDGNGNPHDFTYEDWTAEIDSREPFWLMVNGTELSQGETWFYNGWQPIGGTAPNWQTIFFQIATGYGWGASVNQLGNTTWLSATGETGVIPDLDTNGQDHSFTYERWSAWLDANQPFELTANGTTLPAGETWFYNGWTAIGGAAQNWQTITFNIATGFGSWATVSQGGGSLSLSATGETSVIPDLDTNGQDHSFTYERWTAWLDGNQPFTLTANGTTLPAGETWFYNGWTAIGGPVPVLTLSVTLHGSRASHAFTLTAPDGGTWQWSIADWSGSQVVQLTNPWEAQPWDLTIDIAGASQTFNHTGLQGTWMLSDNSTGENVTFDPAGQGAMALDLAQWYPPAEAIGLQISLSRWGHDLRIRQRNGEEYSITPGASQGSATLSGAVAWYLNEYHFDATGYRRPVTGMDWWVYDADTGEEASLNEVNLIGWISLMPPEQVQAARTGISTVEVTWQVPEFNDVNWLPQGGFYVQRQQNSGAWTPMVTLPAAQAEVSGTPGSFYYTDTSVPLGATYRYRVAYYYGQPAQRSVWRESNTVMMAGDTDTDGDGVSDALEIARNTNPTLWDSDGDGVNDFWDGHPNDPTLSGSVHDGPHLVLLSPASATLVEVLP